MGDKSIKNKNVKKKKKAVANTVVPSIVSSDWTQTQPELIRKKKDK